MVSVRPEKGENIERAINRFNKRCKKLRIVENFMDRTYYEKPSKVRREAKRRRKRVLDKLRKERKE